MAVERRAIDRRQLAIGLLACALAACVLLAGCAQCRLPRIDPTGERIFAPAPDTGPVSPWQVPGRQFRWDPIQVIVSPGVAVAAVRSEVVLVASVLGSDGYLRTNERVEWSVAPGGVGEILEFDRQRICDLLLGDFTWPRRVTNTFAIGSTSRDDLRLTRGTPDPTDDVLVRRGQTWITVTSAVEGTSHVTAYAPDVYGWDRHKQTATIHWIDAQWQFPPPAVNPAGGRHALVTKVARSTDQSPQVGWRVQYRIQGGPPAGFVPDGAQTIEVQTDALGQARAEIFQPQPAAGTNCVAIQVIRPGPGGTQAVGQGSTLVTWTAPGLAVRVGGPAAAAVGATLVYRLEVTNSGDLPADGVVLSTEIARGLSYVNSAPAAAVLGNNLQWQLGRLSGGECRYVEMSVRADTAGTVSQCVEAATASGLRARDCATTAISVGPPAGLGPAYPAPAGPPSGYPAPAPGAPGLLSPPSGFGIGPGAPSAGRQPEPGAGAAPGARRPAGTVLPVSIRIVPPQSAVQGKTAQFGIKVSNTGWQSLSNVEIRLKFDEALAPQKASPNLDVAYVETEKVVLWTLRALLAGQMETATFECLCVEANPKAGLRVRVTSREGGPVEQTASVAIERAGAAGGAPPFGPDGRTTPAASGLQATITTLKEPVEAGWELTYFVTISNAGTAVERDIELTVTLPPELIVSRVDTTAPTIQPAGTTAAEAKPEFKDQKVAFGALTRLEPDQKAEYGIRAQVKAVSQGTVVTVEARVTAPSLPAGGQIVRLLKTTINAPRAAKP